MATGCRVKDAQLQTWEHVYDDHLVLDGKRDRVSRPNLRIVPFFMCPELPVIIETAKGASWSDDVYLFGGKNYQPIGRAFHKALDNKGRGFHDIRKWKINKWVREGVPEAVLEAVGGHEKEVPSELSNSLNHACLREANNPSRPTITTHNFHPPYTNSV